MRSRHVWVAVAVVAAAAAALWLARRQATVTNRTVPPTPAELRAASPDGPFSRPLPTEMIPPVADDAGALSCPGGGCTIACAPDGKCAGACPGGLCRQLCRGGGDCTFTCTGGSCFQRCAPGARCQMSCGGGRCLQDCAGVHASACTRSCEGRGCS